MQMRSLNVNTAPRRTNGPRKQTSARNQAAVAGGPAATFISPPRNPVVSNASKAAATQPGPAAPIVEDFTPEQMLAMAEASYAKCPCETCGAFRDFYAQQVADARAAAAATDAMCTPPRAGAMSAADGVVDAGDVQCPPAELDDDLPSPSAPAGSYYFVPRPMSRQPAQPQQTAVMAAQMAPAGSGSGYQRGSLRQQLGAVPLLARPYSSASATAFTAAAAPMVAMTQPGVEAMYVPEDAYTQVTRPSTSPDPATGYTAPHRARQSSAAFTSGVAAHTISASQGTTTSATASASAGHTAAASAARHTEAIEQFRSAAPGHVVELACTQEGKSLLQAALRARDVSVVDTVVPELCAEMDTVALDANACHVLRLTVELCSAEQLIDIVGTFHETLLLNMCTVSQYTRRTLQALMERQAASRESTAVGAYALDFTAVVEVLANNAAYLSVTQQGCISLMRVFERCAPAQKILLMAPLVPSLAVLAFDPFGNYVTQCAMEHSEVPVASEYVLTCFQNQLLRMSCDKFASNVVEKIIRSCSGEPAVRAMLLDELLFNPAALQELVKDGFGNVVVQSIVDSCTDAGEMKRICDRLKPVLPTSPYAARIEGKLKSKRFLTTPTSSASASASLQHHHNSDRHHGATRPLSSYATNQMRGPQGKQQQQQWQAPHHQQQQHQSIGYTTQQQLVAYATYTEAMVN